MNSLYRNVLVLAALACGAVECRAQDSTDFHQYMVEGSVGYAPVRLADKNYFHGFPVIQVGAGRALTQPRLQPGLDPQYTKWNVLLTGVFLYGKADLNGNALALVQTPGLTNPSTPALLSVTGGHGKFYSAAAGPRLQYWYSEKVNFYGQLQVGWLRRSVDLTGTASEGGILQPGSPAVFEKATNSGVGRLTVGVAAGSKNVRGFAEVGFLQGFGINHETRLWPILSGGIRW